VKGHLDQISPPSQFDHYQSRNIAKRPFEKRLGSLYLAETYFEKVVDSRNCQHVVLFGRLYMSQYSGILDNYMSLLDSCAVGALSPWATAGLPTNFVLSGYRKTTDLTNALFLSHINLKYYKFSCIKRAETRRKFEEVGGIDILSQKGFRFRLNTT